ncbi:Oidioi.mRNA.OKI2018_I69.XSR.g14781.t1.cds [Oikopleura dioica]|uniref:Oidioi.mRNA.OKI2018_I69.XSR.g14781.t1.cds n=1 Tax=Oikopleura dioica TaxID=34765 RepID=A0ABN7SEV3_OIKDI|nr:Oidioi.mRNA.OKI2018_I69.XSR.g14781.t1.cds [Oikopleura dioica]
MENIDLINYRLKRHNEERRQEYQMLTKAVEDQQKKTAAKKDDLKDSFQESKEKNEIAEAKQQEHAILICNELQSQQVKQEGIVNELGRIQDFSKKVEEINDDLIKEDAMLEKALETCKTTKSVHDAICKEVDELQAAWEAKNEKIEQFLEQKLEDVPTYEDPNFEAKAIEQERIFQEEMKKYQQPVGDEEKLVRYEDFAKNLEEQIAKEIHVREVEAKAHGEWMQKKDVEKNGLIKKSKAFCEENEQKYTTAMAECAKLDSSSSTGAGTRDRLQKKFKELGDQRVGREVACGEKKAELEKGKKRVAFMKQMNEDKTGKVRELKEGATDLKRKVERAGKLNMLKREDLEPVANAIQRKRMTIDSVMNDPIFAEIKDLEAKFAAIQVEKEGFLAKIEQAKKQKEEKQAQIGELTKKDDEKQAKFNELAAENASIKLLLEAENERLQEFEEKKEGFKEKLAKGATAREELLERKAKEQKVLESILEKVLDHGRKEAIMKQRLAKTQEELEKKEADLVELKEQLRKKEEEKNSTAAPNHQTLVSLPVQEKESEQAIMSAPTPVLSHISPPVLPEQETNLLSEEEAAPSAQSSIDTTIELMASPPAQKEMASGKAQKAIILKPRHQRNRRSPQERKLNSQPILSEDDEVIKLYDEAELARTTSLMKPARAPDNQSQMSEESYATPIGQHPPTNLWELNRKKSTPKEAENMSSPPSVLFVGEEAAAPTETESIGDDSLLGFLTTPKIPPVAVVKPKTQKPILGGSRKSQSRQSFREPKKARNASSQESNASSLSPLSRGLRNHESPPRIQIKENHKYVQTPKTDRARSVSSKIGPKTPTKSPKPILKTPKSAPSASRKCSKFAVLLTIVNA